MLLSPSSFPATIRYSNDPVKICARNVSYLGLDVRNPDFDACEQQKRRPACASAQFDHQALIVALGAYRTSPTASIYDEAHEPSLNTRREKLSLQCAIKIAENQSNPANEVTFQSKPISL